MSKFVKFCNKTKAVVTTAGVTVLGTAGMALATENGLTTKAVEEMGAVKTDVITLGGVMVGIVATLAIAGIIFALIKKR